MLKRIALATVFLLLVPAFAEAQVAGSFGARGLRFDAPANGERAPRWFQAATAEPPPIFVGGFLGMQLDMEDDWFFLGGEGRLRLQGRAFEINPHLVFQPFEGGSQLQIDLNVLVELELAIPNRFRPFVGLGGAVMRTSSDGESDTAFGLNMVGGVRFDMEGRTPIEPFASITYTIVRDHLNPFRIAVGVAIPLR